MRLWYRFVPVLVCGFLGSTLSADWPQWRGPERSGYVASPELIDTLPATGLRPAWVLRDFPGGNSGGWSSPVISDGLVYLFSHTKTKNPGADPGEAKYPWLPPDKRGGMSDQEYEDYEAQRRDENERRSQAFRYDERLLCLDLESGQVRWDRTIESAYSRFVQSGTPCVAGGRLYVLGAGRVARCLDAVTGETLFEQTLPGEFRDEFFASSFVVHDDVAIVACGPLVALDARDGRLLWKGDTPLDYSSHSSPAVWGAGASAPVDSAPVDSAPVDSAPVDSAPVDSSPVDSSLTFGNTADGITKAYRVADGTKVWELESGTGQSTPVVTGDLLLTYGASRKNGLTAYRLDPDSPARKPAPAWQFRGAADGGSTPLVRGDSVFVQGDKRLAKIRLADGQRQWQTTLRTSNPRYTSLVGAGDQVFFAWEGLQAFDATADKFRPLYEARIDADGVLLESDALRRKLDLDQVAQQPDGLRNSERLWQDEAIKTGPLACSTPALSGGRIVIRLRDAVICYDLRSQLQ